MEGPRYYDRPRRRRDEREGTREQDDRDRRENDAPERGHNSQENTGEGGEFMLVGVHSVTEALRAGRQVEKIMIERDQDTRRLDEMLDLARRGRIPVQKVPRQALDRQAQRHQGVIGFVSALTYVRLSEVFNKIEAADKEPFLICLDGVTDVRNAGAIARTAECAGADALVVPMLGTAMLGPDAMQASAGALGHLPVAREGTLAKGLEFMRKNGIVTVAVTEKANKEIFWADMTGPIALVLGSEERGISHETLSECDFAVKLPMQGHIGSLNVANAASVAIYEVVRQRLMAAKAKEESLKSKGESESPSVQTSEKRPAAKKTPAKKAVKAAAETPSEPIAEPVKKPVAKKAVKAIAEAPQESVAEAPKEKKPRAPRKPKAD